jgi:hypothetical protein
MATRQPEETATAYHMCSCGETFDSTDELLAHAEDVHRFRVQ